MSSANVSGGRKKPRTKEASKPQQLGRLDRQASGHRSSTVLPVAINVVDDAGVATDAPYACTGRFGVDFVQLCRRAQLAYIPPVIARSRRSSLPAPAVDDKRGDRPPPAIKATGRSTAVAMQKMPVITFDQLQQSWAASSIVELPDTSVLEPPAKTYSVRDAIIYFRPSVQVESDKPQLLEQAAVSEVFIHGWKVDDVMMGILGECFPSVTSLHTLDLWNAGINDVTLTRLGAVVARCRSVRTLVLDANRVSLQRWDVLLQEDSPVLHLSLRYCGITELGARYLGEALGSPSHQNTRLLSLDLAGNRVADSGATHLADGLRLNRTLLVLGLAGNGIGDPGATSLARALSSFELTHAEVVERRRLQYVERMRAPSRQLSASKLTAVGRTLSPTGSSHQRAGRKRPGGGPGDGHSKAARSGTAGKAGRSAGTKLDDGRAKKGAGGGAGTKLKKSGQNLRGVESTESTQTPQKLAALSVGRHPLMSTAVLRESTAADPTTLVRGNRSLISLNLARNEIGDAGMTALLDVVLATSREPVAATAGSDARGLLRVAVHGNRPPPAVLGQPKGFPGIPGQPRVAAETESEAAARYLATLISARDPLLLGGRSSGAISPVKPKSSSNISVSEA